MTQPGINPMTCIWDQYATKQLTQIVLCCYRFTILKRDIRNTSSVKLKLNVKTKDAFFSKYLSFNIGILRDISRHIMAYIYCTYRLVCNAYRHKVKALYLKLHCSINNQCLINKYEENKGTKVHFSVDNSNNSAKHINWAASHSKFLL